MYQKVVSTSGLPLDSVLVLMGFGLTDWLFESDTGTHFYPVAHAVPTLSVTQSRSVFARMKVAPMEAIRLKRNITFSDFFFQNKKGHLDQSYKQ